jgi:hypothetical protein
MRKILLATTALVGFVAAGAAQAATAPLNVTVGGSVDFVAGTSHESKASGMTNPTDGDFETIYSLVFDMNGKAANGLEYGGELVLDNDIDPATTPPFGGNSNTVAVTRAFVFMSGAFGKIQVGDSHGSTDLTVMAPSVSGIRYLDFLDLSLFAKNFIVGIDGKDHSTNVTYYTPKIGNDMGKLQAAVTYAPNFNSYGSTVSLTETGMYKNVIKGAVAYTGNISSVAVTASANIITGATDSSSIYRDFTAWGVGAQAARNGFTVGANYVDKGHHSMIAGDTKDEQLYGAGLKYEFYKLAVGFNYNGGEGYNGGIVDPLAPMVPNDYVKTFNAYGIGGAYTWAPGLTTNVSGVLFNQELDTGTDNDGYVLLVSQKLTF